MDGVLKKWLQCQTDIKKPLVIDSGAFDYYHDEGIRDLTYLIKSGDEDAILKAAELMSIRVKEGSILIPIPNSSGKAEYTLALANKISNMSNSVVLNALYGKPRQPLHDSKKKKNAKNHPIVDETLPDITFSLDKVAASILADAVGDDCNVYLVDNVISTGKTMQAALSLIPNAIPLVFSQDRSLDDSENTHENNPNDDHVTLKSTIDNIGYELI